MKNNHLLIMLILAFFSCKKEYSTNTALPEGTFSIEGAMELYSKLQNDNSFSNRFPALKGQSPSWAYVSISGDSAVRRIVVPFSNVKTVTRFTDSSKEIGTPALMFENTSFGSTVDLLIINAPSANYPRSYIRYSAELDKASFHRSAKRNAKSFGRPPTTEYMICSQTDWYTCTESGGISYGCNYNYTATQCLDLPDGGSGGSSGDPGGGDGVYWNYLDYANLILPPVTERAVEIRNYVACFSSSPRARYEVKLCVRQPKVGSRAKVADANGNTDPSSMDYTALTAGHTFITLDQIFVITREPMRVTRSVGFYPGTITKPISPVAPGLYADDSGQSFDIAVTIQVDANSFFTILDALQNSTSGTYNLNTNNCTSVCLDALTKAGIQLPKTVGKWPIGEGLNPADLGEDLRSLPVGGNITAKIIGGTAPSNTAPCN
ncbi:hypothetical protein [Chitinophaga sp. sic0106]|uniref:hypothetical protein n=1 Tax=Chitinophaga sp. sic0106 TaxID=2854785 RepID=UPI001C43F9C0|nr:hypothetical protein [Chitinophaga sp. sic0106]MBV7530997.1 hypothetical protein [Chitinophaga sp. sic0106]